MNKPDQLRAALVAALPELADDPNRLRMWVEDGSATSRLAPATAPAHGFEMRYRLTVIVEAWTQSPLLILVIILDWLRTAQPDQLAVTSERALRFEADILDANTFDLAFDLDLTEAIDATQREDGGFDMLPRAEPLPVLGNDQPIGGPLTNVWMGDDHLVPGT